MLGFWQLSSWFGPWALTPRKDGQLGYLNNLRGKVPTAILNRKLFGSQIRKPALLLLVHRHFRIGGL